MACRLQSSPCFVAHRSGNDAVGVLLQGSHLIFATDLQHVHVDVSDFCFLPLPNPIRIFFFKSEDPIPRGEVVGGWVWGGPPWGGG